MISPRLSVAVILLASFALPCLAATALTPMTADFAHYVTLSGQTIQPGQLVSLVNDHYELSSTPYDNSLIGVIIANTAVAINTVGHDNTYPIVNSDTAPVLVSASGGPLTAGDPITSSDQPGIATKATRAGFIVGQALEDFNPSDPTKVKAINTMLTFKWADVQGSLSPDQSLLQQIIGQIGSSLQLSTVAALEKPSIALKYTLAILVLLLSFILGFYIFGRVATSGITAISRNPLAKRSIGLAVSINVLITIAIIASGLVVSILILTS